MAAPTIGYLDPVMVRLMDDIREKLARTCGAADGSFAFAVSGTGTSGMETSVANLVKEGTRDRLAGMCERYGATVTRLDVEWGRAADPEALRRQLKASDADVVAIVHAETRSAC